MSILMTPQVVYDGERRAVIEASAMSVDDAAPDNLTLETLVDISTLVPVPEQVRVERIEGEVSYGVVELYWAALSPVRFAVLSGDKIDFDYSESRTLRMPPEGTGDILISTVGFAPTSTFMLKLGLIKRVL